VEISQAGFGDGGATAIVLARHDLYADALAGTPLAVARTAPLLLTPTNQLDPRVAAEMQRVLAPGGPVFILGGPMAISEGTESAVRALGFNTRRFQGHDRYATAVAIADELGNPQTLLLATGVDFPDAASAGAAGASQDGAVLLTVGDRLPPETASYLAQHPSAKRFAVGGPAATADPGATPLFGSGRYETAVAVAKQFFVDVKAVGIVSGVEFADAITGGTHMGRLRGPILLTAPAKLPGDTEVWLRDHASTVVGAFIFGGTNAVSSAVEDEIRVALNG
jgi:putative cell wall-binding protein